MARVFSIILIFLIGLGLTSSLAADKLPLATAEWPPYTSSSLEGHGFVVEFIAEVVEEMGMVPVFRFYPWSRTQEIVASGSVFGGFPFGITQKRLIKFNYSNLFLKTNAKFFYDKNRFENLQEGVNIQDLKSYTVGVVRKSKTLAKLQKAGFQKIYELNNVEQVINMLKLERIQLAALVEYTGWYNLQKLPPAQINNWGSIQFYKMEAALLISRDYPDNEQLQEKFNQALKVVQGRGTYEKLLLKYGLPVP